MNVIMKKLLFIVLCVVNILCIAQKEPPAPPSTAKDVVGPGTPASPIDMYIYLLIVIAVVMIAVFAKKTKQTV